MALTAAELRSYIDDLMKREEIANYKVEIMGGNAKGEGFLGEVAFINVKSSRKNYDLVVKFAKQSDELRKMTPIKEVYDREIYFYQKIIPIYEELQSENCVTNIFKSYPKCFGVCEDDRKEAVILQNMKAIGYDMHNKKKAMNLNHVKMIFTQYGKLHGLSLALKAKKPNLYKNLTKNMTNLMGKLLVEGKFMSVFHKDIANVKKVLEKSHEDATLAKFKNFENNIEAILTDDSSTFNNNSVILHGDCWNNNFMFKYENDNTTNPVSMVFLDFQLSRVGSPVFDLSYFLYSCADAHVLKHFDYLLQVYHSSLSDFLAEFKCDAEEIFPFKRLKEEWKKYGKYGLTMAAFLIRIVLCDAADAPDFAETAESGGNLDESFMFELGDSKEYDRRVRDIFVHFAEEFL